MTDAMPVFLLCIPSRPNDGFGLDKTTHITVNHSIGFKNPSRLVLTCPEINVSQKFTSTTRSITQLVP